MQTRFSILLMSALAAMALVFQASAQPVAVANGQEAQKQQIFTAYSDLCFMKKELTASYCVLAVQQLVEATNVSAMIGNKQMLPAADDLLSTGCTLEEGRSCMWQLHPSVRSFYSSSDVVASFQKGVSLLGPQCQEGMASSCRFFAEGLWWFSEGASLPEQLKRAMPAALKRSCDLGNKAGCLALANAVADGTHGFPQNTEAASNLRKQLCEHNYQAACDTNETMQSETEGVDFGQLNYDLAKMQEDAGGDKNALLISYLEACAFDHAKGCEEAGALLFHGKHVSRDRSLGFRLFEKSCELGKTLDGCIAAGFVLQTGDGVLQNEMQTAEYYIKAYERACESSEAKRLRYAACRGFR